ncbi:MAG: gamma-glutamylcyclotransferase family protein [Thermoguttaceae bacterium]
MIIWYFAYGSNLDFVQIRGRCPSAEYVCRAVLKNHVLAFTRRSTTRRCGVADVIPEHGHDVWGVIYQIKDTDLVALDGNEGFKPARPPEANVYNRDDKVHVLAENDERQPMTVSTYFATKQPTPPRPSEAYMRQIIDGAKFWKLPPQYIEELQRVPTSG